MSVVVPFYLTSTSWIKWKSLIVKWSLMQYVTTNTHILVQKENVVFLCYFNYCLRFFQLFLSPSLRVKFTVFLPETRIRKGCLLLMNQWNLQAAFKQMWYSNGGWLIWNQSFLTNTSRAFFDRKHMQRRGIFCARLHECISLDFWEIFFIAEPGATLVD